MPREEATRQDNSTLIDHEEQQTLGRRGDIDSMDSIYATVNCCSS